MNKPTYVAFSTQKGGAGKTTITVLVASYLHYVKGYNVAVVDCDFPQYSIHDMRKRDMDMTMKDNHYKAMAYEQFKRLAKKAYPVVCSKPNDAADAAARLAESGVPLDFVFFDLPGTINNPSDENRIGDAQLQPFREPVGPVAPYRFLRSGNQHGPFIRRRPGAGHEPHSHSQRSINANKCHAPGHDQLPFAAVTRPFLRRASVSPY